jgi:hypothetical protein
MSEAFAWAAGFFEGEGCFYAHYYKARVNGTRVFRTAASLVQKDRGLLVHFKRVVLDRAKAREEPLLRSFY